MEPEELKVKVAYINTVTFCNNYNLGGFWFGKFVFQVALCKPRGIYICDGSEEEAQEITDKLVMRGNLQKLHKMDNW